MAGSAALRFCAKTLEADVGLRGTFLAMSGAPRIRGALRAARVPADLQVNEVGPGGEVLHLASLSVHVPEVDPAVAAGVGGTAASSGGAAATRGGSKRPGANAHTAGAEGEEAPAAAKPWVAALYARGQRPHLAARLLASELRVPRGALAVQGSLSCPGILVQRVSLPPALVAAASRGPGAALLHGGLLQGPVLVAAVGAATTSADAELAAPVRRKSLAQRKAEKRRGPAQWRCEGHRYSVVLRGLDQQQVDDGTLEEALERLSEEGFVNFFELASFGLAEVRRYEVGSALWGGQWDLAARLLLTANRAPDGVAKSPAEAAAEAFCKGDLARGLDLLPEQGAEGMKALAMQLLLRRPALEALQKAVPPPVWARHLSAVARLAWNRAAAARLTGLPRRPLLGDLVLDETTGEARPLTHSEAKNRSIEDIYIPLPRIGEPVPECTSRLLLERTVRQLVPGDDAPSSAFPLALSRLLPKARRLVSVPSDMSWDTVDAGTGPVVDCDLARLGNEAPDVPPDAGSGSHRPSGRRSAASGRQSVFGGSLRGPALRLRFTLPRGGGTAEPLLRELLRADPSEFQEGLGRQDELF